MRHKVRGAKRAGSNEPGAAAMLPPLSNPGGNVREDYAYAIDAAARYAAAGDWIMVRAMFAAAQRLRRMIVMATTTPSVRIALMVSADKRW